MTKRHHIQTHPLEALADNELMELLIKDSGKAYEVLYNRYFDLISGYAYKQLRDKELSKDIIQDVCTNLWLKRTQLNPSLNFPGYLITIVNRKITDYFLHQKVANKYLDSFSSSVQSESKTDHPIREKQLLAFIEREIAALPERMRIAFELSRKGNLSHKEIAAQMDISEKTVSRQVSNALKILRARLGIVVWLVFIFRF